MGVVIVRSLRGLRQDVLCGTHHLSLDEPPGAGGRDVGPSPYDLLLASLGSCTATTLEIFARREGWPLERVVVRLRHERLHQKDCGSSEDAWLDRIEREVVIEGPLDPRQRQKLLEVADRCPVQRTLLGRVKVETRVASSDAPFAQERGAA